MPSTEEAVANGHADGSNVDGDSKTPEKPVESNANASNAEAKKKSPSQDAAAAAKVRLKAHVVLEKVKNSESKRELLGTPVGTPRDSCVDPEEKEAEARRHEEEEAAATAAVEAAGKKAEEAAATAAITAAALKKEEEEKAEIDAAAAEAKRNKEKEIEEKKKESSEELTRRLQKLALERQKESRHDRLRVIQADQSSHLSSAKTFQELQLPEHLLTALFEMGFERPSAIQEEALPRILADPPRNVIGQAQSGSGKTAAFVLGMLHKVVVDAPATCQALCVTPTRELAVQIFQNAVTPMAAHMRGLRVRLALAGETIERGARLDAHVVVGTPGKVVDWLKRRIINTKTIKVFVLDEADNMVSEDGHRANSLLIKKQMPKRCQSLLFSATFPAEVLAFSEKMVHNPDKILIESGPEFLVSCTAVNLAHALCDYA